MIGGLGSGKTRTGAEAFVDLVIGNPGCLHIMAGPTHEMTRDLCVPAFEAACPRGLIVRYIKSERTYRLVGGRSVKHGSADKPSSMEGRNAAGGWADEVRYWPRASYQNFTARMRDRAARRLQVLVTTTPDPGWLADEFNAGREGRTVYRASTRENAPNLAPGYIEGLERTYSARLAKSLIDGEFTVVEGQVWEAYDAKRHVVPWRVDLDLPVIVAMDFGVRHASVILAQQVPGPWPYQLADGREIPAGSLVIFDELQPEQCSTERAIPRIQARLQGHGIGSVDALYCDPAGNARDIASGMESVHLLRAAFGPVVSFTTAPRLTHVPHGIGRVESLLAPLRGEPTLYVSSEVAAHDGRTHDNDYTRGVARTFAGLQYPEAKDGRTAPDRYAKDGRFEHCADTLRYLVINAELARGYEGEPTRIVKRFG